MGNNKCFEAWLASRGGTTAQEGNEILRQVRHFFEQHGDSKFTIIGENDSRIINHRAGYKKWVQETGTWIFFVLPESFKQDICSGFDLSIASAILIEKRWLVPDSEGKSTRRIFLVRKAQRDAIDLMVTKYFRMKFKTR